MTYVSTNIFGSSLLQPQKQILHSGSNHFQRRKLHSRNRSPRRRRGSGNRSFPVRGRRLHNGSGLLRRLLINLPQRVGCHTGQPFSLLIYRHIFALIGLSALRHRLYAERRGQALHIFRVPGRFARATSELTAQRFKVLFFLRGSTAFRTLFREGSYWSCLTRRSRSYRHFPPLPSLSRQ